MSSQEQVAASLGMTGEEKIETQRLLEVLFPVGFPVRKWRIGPSVRPSATLEIGRLDGAQEFCSGGIMDFLIKMRTGIRNSMFSLFHMTGMSFGRIGSDQ